MWRYSNPVAITFGADAFAELPKLVAGQPYALVTYPDAPFVALAERLRHAAGEPVVTISDVAPNPDTRLLAEQSARFGAVDEPEVIVALGGGSVIDTAKVLAAAGRGFAAVLRYLTAGTGAETLSATPIIAVPTTAGTGSEVTSWATVWDTQSGKKYSLSRPNLYPRHALVDPEADDRKAAPAHDQHRARRAVACARKSVERECESRSRRTMRSWRRAKSSPSCLNS